MIDKGECDKGYIWNPPSCECKCYKSCDFSGYLDFKNCMCKERLVDKLSEECTENIDEKRQAEKNSTDCKHNSGTLDIMLLSILFTVNIGIRRTWWTYECQKSNK